MTLTDKEHQRKPRQTHNTSPPFHEGSTELAWLRLGCARLPPARLAQLLKHVESPQELFDKSLQCMQSGSTRENKALQKIQESYPLAERALRWNEGENCHLIARGTEHYPALLEQIADPPAVLFVRGNLSALHYPQLAIVGSRKAGPPARSITRRWASELAQLGFSITSGLARGVDAQAHLGSLDVNGISIAVMASGPELCYPTTHKHMLENLLVNGASVTEFPPTTTPVPRNFPQRNRIISGLCLGTLIMEAELKSGSLVTARLAMEQDREVFAMPGSVMNPLASGCHHLIQQGAKLVHSISDIVEELGGHLHSETTVAASVVTEFVTEFVAEAETTGNQSTTNERAADSVELRQSSDIPSMNKLPDLLKAVGFEPFTANSVAETTGNEISTVISELLLLELQGKLASLGDGRYVRI